MASNGRARIRVWVCLSVFVAGATLQGQAIPAAALPPVPARAQVNARSSDVEFRFDPAGWRRASPGELRFDAGGWRQVTRAHADPRPPIGTNGLRSIAEFQRLVRLSWRDSLAVAASRAESLALRSPEPLGREGAATAPLVVEVFEDYQCPFCALQETVSKRVLHDYAARGLVRVIYYDFPLSQIHPFAVDGAMFVACAGEQHQFLPARAALYARQPEWTQGTDPRAAFRRIAAALHLDVPRTMSCYEAGSHHAVLTFGFQQAIARGVDRTPYFLVAGARYPGGAPTIAAFQAIIEQTLRGTVPTIVNTAPAWKSAALQATGGAARPPQ